MKRVFIFVIFLLINSAHALFGDGGAGYAQLPYLIKILSENVRRYQQLKEMIKTAKERDQYLRLINEGLVNAVGLLEALPVKDERILGQLKTFKKGLNTVTKIYGEIPKSKEASFHKLHDQSVAESITMANAFKRYAHIQEANSLKIAKQGRMASPAGAQRIQAEASAQILRSLSQLIRLNTQMLKLQSENLAIVNKTHKDSVGRYQQLQQNFKRGPKNLNRDFKLYRY